MKNIMIEKELFDAIVLYHLFSDIDQRNDVALNRKIRAGLENKLKRVHLHNLYSESKTNKDKALKELARQQYLNTKGVGSDFRW